MFQNNNFFTVCTVLLYTVNTYVIKLVNTDSEMKIQTTLYSYLQGNDFLNNKKWKIISKDSGYVWKIKLSLR